MERRPISSQIHYGDPQNLASPPSHRTPTTPDSQGDAIEPFLLGGGASYYLEPFSNPAPIEVAANAVQLLASIHVPPGRSAFIKQIVAAPCISPIFADPWRGWPATFNERDPGPVPRSSTNRAAAQAGLWETPLAWEGYRSETGTGEAPPVPLGPTIWRWHLTAFPGSLDLQRSKLRIPPFDVANPASWYLVPDEAVPASAYAAGLPGKFINGYIGPQRFQAIPTAPLNVHYACPENTTICLWATWTQGRCTPIMAQGPNGPIQPWAGAAEFPLLPSVGRLSGYMQAASRPAVAQNAAHGWGA